MADISTYHSRESTDLNKMNNVSVLVTVSQHAQYQGPDTGTSNWSTTIIDVSYTCVRQWKIPADCLNYCGCVIHRRIEYNTQIKPFKNTILAAFEAHPWFEAVLVSQSLST